MALAVPQVAPVELARFWPAPCRYRGRFDQLNPRHLRLVASYVVPITGHQDYRSWPGYPPVPQQHGVEWSQHTVAKGAQRRANGRRSARESGCCPQTDGTGLKTLAIDLTYREGGTQYRMQTHYPLLILIGVLRACAGNWPKKYHVQV